jgi:hypothetical protein
MSPCVQSCIDRDHLPLLSEEFNLHDRIKYSRTHQENQAKIQKNFDKNLLVMRVNSSGHRHYAISLNL